MIVKATIEALKKLKTGDPILYRGTRAEWIEPNTIIADGEGALLGFDTNDPYETSDLVPIQLSDFQIILEDKRCYYFVDL